jgi:hypothetical protein
MPVVTPTEIHDRVTHFFHEVLKSAPAGHSPVMESCWLCQATTYAVLTTPAKQEVKSSFHEELNVSW